MSRREYDIYAYVMELTNMYDRLSSLSLLSRREYDIYAYVMELTNRYDRLPSLSLF
jgi:hypothetical protein